MTHPRPLPRARRRTRRPDRDGGRPGAARRGRRQSGHPVRERPGRVRATRPRTRCASWCIGQLTPTSSRPRRASWRGSRASHAHCPPVGGPLPWRCRRGARSARPGRQARCHSLVQLRSTPPGGSAACRWTTSRRVIPPPRLASREARPQPGSSPSG